MLKDLRDHPLRVVLRDLYVGEMIVVLLVAVTLAEIYMSIKRHHGQLVRVSSKISQTVIHSLVLLYRLMEPLIYMI